MGQNLKKITDEYFDINKNVGGRLELYREIMEVKGKVQMREKEKANG